MADVSFNVANPYQTQLEELARRQKMAEIMQQQSFQPMERFSYQGIEAPISPLSGLAKALQGYTSGREQEDIAKENKAVGEKYQSDLMSTLNRANELAMGKPATPFDATEFGGEAGMNPAVAPDRDAAAREYFKHPATQAMGMAEMQKNAQLQRLLRAGEPQATTGATPAAGGTPPMGGAQTTPILGTPPIGGAQDGKPIASGLSRWGQPAGGQPMAAWLETDPSGKSYIEQLAKESLEANKPTDIIRNLRAAGVREGSPQWNAALTNINTAGGIYQPNAQGGVGLAPGVAQGAGSIKEAETEATSRNAISTREIGGRNVTGTDRQFNILANGIAPTDQEAQSVAEWANRNGIKISINGPRSQTPGVQPVGESQSAGVINPTPAEAAGAKTRIETRAKNEVGREEQLLRTGYQEAQSMLNNLDLMQSLASDPNVAQGKLADQISGLKSIGQSLGIKTEGLPAEEAIKAISIEMALKAKNQGGTNLMPGSMSNFEQQMLQSMTPQLAQSREGRDLLIQVFRQKALRDQKISELATEYYDKNGKLDYNFEKEVRAYSKANPMFSPMQIKLYQDASKRLTEKK